MDSGKKGKMRGTFAAVEERIPYLKALGVTTVELMPVYEFEEIEIPKKQKLPGYIPQRKKNGKSITGDMRRDPILRRKPLMGIVKM